MRFIDRTNCKSAFDKGIDLDITQRGALSRKATKIAEAHRLAVLKRRDGYFRIISASGLGSEEHAGAIFSTLAEVDQYLKKI